MTIKIVDACCVISYCEKITSKDVIGLCAEHEYLSTEIVREEVNNRGCMDPRIDVHCLNDMERKLYKNIRENEGIEDGESSIISFVLHHNERVEDSVVLITDDRRALKVFQNLIKDEYIQKTFPNVNKIIGSDSIDLLNRHFDKGLLSSDEMNIIKIEMKTRIPKNRLCCLKC